MVESVVCVFTDFSSAQRYLIFSLKKNEMCFEVIIV